MGFAREIRHAARTLLRSPGFAVAAVLTLALGIGANTAIFSVVNAIILRPLTYPDPAELVHISSQFTPRFDQFWISPPEFLELQERARAWSAIGAFSVGQANLSAPDRPRRVTAARVSAGLFTALAVPAMRGRWFEPAETRPNGPSVIVLSYDVWRTAFGGDPTLVGGQIEVNGLRRTVVGIMPPGFDLMDEHVEVWVPLVLDPANRQNRGNHYLYLIGRLREGTTLDAARAELETLLAAWPESIAKPADATRGPHTPNLTGHRLRLDPLQAQMVGNARAAILVLQGAVVLVLLIACANIASLLLVRAESQRRELAVRAALGAGRHHLLARFMAEGAWLSLAGGALGLVVGVFGVRALIAAYPDSLPRAAEVTLDRGVLTFTFAVALASAAAFGLAPLLHFGPDATAAALRDGGSRSSAGAGPARVRRALVASEVAMAVALVIGAGLLLRSVMNLSRVDSGFDRARLLTFAVSLPPATYNNPSQILSFYQRLMESVRAMPQVQGVAAMTGLPPLRDVNANDTVIEGYVAPPAGPGHNVEYYQTVTNGYVEVMGIVVVDGRAFQPSDALGPPTVMINEAMAQTFYAGRSPVDRRVRPSGGIDPPWYTIIGVLKDVKQAGVDRKTGTELYFNFEQLANSRPAAMPATMNLVARSAVPPRMLSGAINRAVVALDPSIPVIRLQSMDAAFEQAIGRPRLLADLLGMFAALAVLLAAMGSYGMFSYMVTERRREIGIRMALGAGRDSVLGMVLSQGLRPTVVGVVAGLALAFALSRVLTTLLFGVGPADPLTMGAVVAVMTSVAVVGCYLPARAATRVDPIIVLRED